MSSNPGRAELGVRSTSALNHTWSKNISKWYIKCIFQYFQTSMSATVTRVWMAPPVKMVYSSTHAAVLTATQEHTVKQVSVL